MRKLTKWFMMISLGAMIGLSSCVDQIKFGDSFLEKAPDTGDMTQDVLRIALSMERLRCKDEYRHV